MIFFQFIVMNSWKINTNLPFLFGDRQAVKSGSIVFPFRIYIGSEISLSKTVVFSPKEGAGGGGDRIYIRHFKYCFSTFHNLFQN